MTTHADNPPRSTPGPEDVITVRRADLENWYDMLSFSSEEDAEDNAVEWADSVHDSLGQLLGRPESEEASQRGGAACDDCGDPLGSRSAEEQCLASRAADLPTTGNN